MHDPYSQQQVAGTSSQSLTVARHPGVNVTDEPNRNNYVQVPDVLLLRQQVADYKREQEARRNQSARVPAPERDNVLVGHASVGQRFQLESNPESFARHAMHYSAGAYTPTSTRQSALGEHGRTPWTYGGAFFNGCIRRYPHCLLAAHRTSGATQSLATIRAGSVDNETREPAYSPEPFESNEQALYEHQELEGQIVEYEHLSFAEQDAGIPCTTQSAPRPWIVIHNNAEHPIYVRVRVNGKRHNEKIRLPLIGQADGMLNRETMILFGNSTVRLTFEGRIKAPKINARTWLPAQKKMITEDLTLDGRCVDTSPINEQISGGTSGLVYKNTGQGEVNATVPVLMVHIAPPRTADAKWSFNDSMVIMSMTDI